MRHPTQARGIELLQLQFIGKWRLLPIIDTVKQRLFRQCQIVSVPWLKPEVKPTAEMRVFDGDAVPDQVDVPDPLNPEDQAPEKPLSGDEIGA